MLDHCLWHLQLSNHAFWRKVDIYSIRLSNVEKSETTDHNIHIFLGLLRKFVPFLIAVPRSTKKKLCKMCVQLDICKLFNEKSFAERGTGMSNWKLVATRAGSKLRSFKVFLIFSQETKLYINRSMKEPCGLVMISTRLELDMPVLYYDCMNLNNFKIIKILLRLISY